MPISSTEISALAGGFNQQVMLGMQHSAMITQQFGGYAPNPATQPVPTAGQNFANLMTMAGGQAGLNALQRPGAQNFLGGVPSGFAQMGLGQMMYGAQQQQMFQTQMQQAYRFPNQMGGRGFNQGQLQGMGADLRQMALERGPGGEQTSFEELSRLASNMGRMGLAQNVQSVKEFNAKFKEMVQTVKTIATELGTGLEDAQRMMSSMKGAGIFRNQGQIAGMMRQGALAGNISTAELSAAGMMGSQISRSIGGRGRAGAMAGMEAMTRVGVAQQTGVLSEEDIYNTTGLTGAEGRQAFTQNMLGMEARFWKSGLGRRTLASVAGQGGRVNKEDVASYLAGGVGTGETMGMAGRNLNKVGRADFLLNEGRLRGEAMQAFGGMGMATVARGWLEQRGLDPNSARGQLFMQRRFNISREDAESLGKMVQNLPTMQMHRRVSQQEDEMERSLETAGRRGSPTEVIKKFEQARDKVNDKIRQFGADVNSQTANFLDNLLGKVMKNYERRVDRTLAPALESLKHGQGNADEILGREMGLGGKASPMATQALQAARAHTGLTAGKGPISAQQLGSFVASNYDALKKAGYDPTKITSVQQLEQVQREMRSKGQPELQGRLAGEGKFATREAEAFARSSDLFRGVRDKRAEDLNVLREPLEQAGLFAGGEGTKVGRAVLGLSRSLEDRLFKPISDKQKELLASGAAGRAATAPRRAAMAGLGFLERGARGLFGDEGVTGAVGRDVTGRVGAALEGVLGEAEQRAEAVFESALGGISVGERSATMDFMGSKTGKDVMKGAYSEDAAVREAARDKRTKRLEELKAKEGLSLSEKGEIHGLEAVGVGQALMEFQQKNKKEPQTEAEWAAIAKAAGVPADRVQKQAQFALKSYGVMLDENQAQYMEEGRRAAGKEMGLLNQQAPKLDELRKQGKLSEGADAYLQNVRALQEKRAQAQSPEELAAIDKQFQEFREKDMAGLTTAQKKERAKELRGLEEQGVELTDSQKVQIESLEQRAAGETRFTRARAGGERGAAREVGRQLGVSLGARELRGKSGSQAIDLIMDQSGLAASGVGEDEKKAIKAKLKDVVKSADPREQAKIMESIQSQHGKAFVEAKKEQQEKKAAAEDPNYRKMGEVKTSVDNVKDAINTMSANLQSAITKDAKPEKKGP